MGALTETVPKYVPPSFVRFLKALRSSFLLSIATIGVCMIVLASILHVEIGVRNGVLAGMFGVWGISAIVAATVSYAVIQYAYTR